MKVFEGLSAKNKSIILLSLGYSSAAFAFGYLAKRQQKMQEWHEDVAYYRYAGHYKHPWEKKPAPVPEHVRKTDYVKMIENPQGLLRV